MGQKLGSSCLVDYRKKRPNDPATSTKVNIILCTDTAHHAADHRRFGGHHRDRERVRSPQPRAPVPRPGTCCARRVGRRGFRLGRFEWICASLRPSDVVFCRCPSAAIPLCFLLVQAMKAEESPLKKLAIPAAVMPFLAPVAAFAAEGTGRVRFLFFMFLCRPCVCVCVSCCTHPVTTHLFASPVLYTCFLLRAIGNLFSPRLRNPTTKSTTSSTHPLPH